MVASLAFNQMATVRFCVPLPGNNMTDHEIRYLSNRALLELYDDFIKWSHYEAVDEFDRLRKMDISLSEVREEVRRRMG